MSLREEILAEERLRHRRAAALPADLLGEPAWDMLLSLAIDRLDGRKSSISDARFLSNSPPTTSLRYVSRLIEAGLASRCRDPNDGRRSWLTLTDAGMEAVEACFEQRLRAAA